MWTRVTFLFVFVPLFVNCVRIINSGAKYPPTKGEVWPKAQHEVKEDIYYVLAGDGDFNVKITNYNCDLLEEAALRLLHQNLAKKASYLMRPNSEKLPPAHDAFYRGTYNANKTNLIIELIHECETYPHFDMDESYNLTVRENVRLSSASIWGILRGLETFNHLLYFSDDYSEIRINATSIVDYPAYKYRGLLIDTGRHYLGMKTLESIIDAMAMNKMNVLHWHIVDDQSFPYLSEKFPTLSEKGAYHSSMVYTKMDIKYIIELGRRAGIRVIPEFDVPGHVRSWGEAYPEILTKCYKEKVPVGLGPLNPTKNETYQFLQQLYQEIEELFPDQYIHIGGDEVDSSCWRSNPAIMEYMKKNKFNTKQLHAQFMKRVLSLLPPQAKSMFWQEVYDNGVSLPKKSLIQVWKYQWVNEMHNILKAGHRVVFSSSWYLDYLKYGWETFYGADPRQMVYNLHSSDVNLEDIVGGEACMWGEMADEVNIISRTWPRASAVAERLWTGLDYQLPKTHDPVTDHVRRRIEEHACRMSQRDIDAEPPNGPGFCIKVPISTRK